MSKLKRFWIIGLKIRANIATSSPGRFSLAFLNTAVTKHVNKTRYRISLMRLHWVFTVQTVVILPRNTFAFMFNRPRSTYTGRAGGSARGKGFNDTFFTRSSVCSMWPDGNDMCRRIDDPEFACFLFFLSFSFGLVFFLLLPFFFCFFILLTKIFRFINFLLYCLILQFSRSPS